MASAGKKTIMNEARAQAFCEMAATILGFFKGKEKTPRSCKEEINVSFSL